MKDLLDRTIKCQKEIDDEKGMEKQKFQFENDEQARYYGKFLKDYYGIEIEEWIRLMKLPKNNFIRKSELQQLVNEVEDMIEMFNRIVEPVSQINVKSFQILIKGFQTLKKEVNRLGGNV